MNINNIRSKLGDLKKSINPSLGLEKGISIIMPVYDGIEYLASCLTSINNQIITTAKFEIIIVLNGKFIEEFDYLNSTPYENLDIIVLINDKASAGNARNMGKRAARYSHVTFVDVDDYLSPNYIQSNFEYMSENAITISQIHDDIDGELDEKNSLNREVIENSGDKSVPLMNVQKIASITVCKVIPKELIILQDFRDYLRSGEDTVFYCELFVNTRPKLIVIPLEEESIYYRRVRKNSVSRKSSSFDFLVYQRLEIMEILENILNRINNPTLKKFVTIKYNAQISFMNKYVRENPTDREKIINVVESMRFKNFNYSILNRGMAKSLVLSYCFPPFSDTSATIVSKRIVEKEEIVDVVSNNMRKIRHEEPSLNNIIEKYIAKKVTVNKPASFSNMYYLSDYIDSALKMYINNIEQYSSIYSRAMFPVSHIPGYFIKKLSPEVKWIAEFSDPLLFNIESETRNAEMQNKGLVESLSKDNLGIFSECVDDNLFNLAELIPFALADELIFTNENQLEYMISRFDEEQKEFIRSKAIISHHPTLPEEYYSLDETSFEMEDSIVNIAYFGNFYSRRGYKHFISLVNELNDKFNLIFKLHIFTNINQLDIESQEELESSNVAVYDYLSFTKYLNALTKLDVLLISDADTKENKPYNPYLPSKLSDYLGSGSLILAMTEQSSVMSKMTDDNLFKINMDQLNKIIDSNEFENNKVINDFVNEIFRKKTVKEGRYLEYNNEAMKLKEDSKVIMEVSKDLELSNLGMRNWLVKPKAVPIMPKDKFIVHLYNNTQSNKVVTIKGYYSVSKVIYVELKDDQNNLIELIDISNLRKSGYQIELKPEGRVKLRIKYKRLYKKEGFIRAGRISILGV